MKLLIIKLSAFGDIIHALPALDDLLARPEVREIHWLIDARYGFVAELLPPEVRPHIVRMKGRGGWRRAWGCARALRAERFDGVLELQGLIKSGLMARAVGAPAWGFDRRQSPEWPNRLLVRPVAFHPEERHVVQCYRRIAAAPFCPAPDRVPEEPLPYRPPRLHGIDALRAAGEEVVRRWRLPRHFILCHIGGSYATKRLPDGGWRRLLPLLAARAPVVVLWGGREEQLRAEAVAQGITGVRAADERLPIAQLAGLLARSRGYVGPDSGVSHLASAVGCRTVTFWGPTAPQRMGALGTADRHVVSEVPCGPCFRRRCDRFVCLPSLDVERIAAALFDVDSP
ncbi:MAG: lipopolysaccharide heptosyltransferase family protein [Zetaproteobacteria bacterium]|nr:MAG: lipopolysaccharide heptosyltransferase family protein [Zetaproteobacteria bacterium]